MNRFPTPKVKVTRRRVDKSGNDMTRDHEGWNEANMPKEKEKPKAVPKPTAKKEAKKEDK